MSPFSGLEMDGLGAPFPRAHALGYGKAALPDWWRRLPPPFVPESRNC